MSNRQLDACEVDSGTTRIQRQRCAQSNVIENVIKAILFQIYILSNTCLCWNKNFVFQSGGGCCSHGKTFVASGCYKLGRYCEICAVFVWQECSCGKLFILHSCQHPAKNLSCSLPRERAKLRPCSAVQKIISTQLQELEDIEMKRGNYDRRLKSQEMRCKLK